MSRRVVVTGYDLITGLGIGREANRRIFRGETGLVEREMSAAGETVRGMLGDAGELPGKEDRCIEMARMTAESAMKEAGLSDAGTAPERFGISIGTSLGGMLSGNRYHEQWLSEGFSAADGEKLKVYPLHAVADTVALRFGLKGYRNTISTACAASGNAVGYAFDVIRDGSQDLMIAGGVDPLCRFSFSGFTALKAIDPEMCRPYSASTGINLGEGAAFFVLEEYEHARERGAKILAEVFACGLSADAYHQTAPARGGAGAVRSMRAALEDAGVQPEEISYVNGHGTGTNANDTNESLAFREVFGETEIPLSSTKGATGHCLGAAGAVECAVCLMAMEENTVPPTIRFEKEFEGKNGINYVPNRSQERKMEKILTNSFAFGGNNCSLLVGRENGKPAVEDPEEDEIVITGIGCAGTGGADIQELFGTFRERKRCTGKSAALADKPYAGKFTAEMPEIPWKRYIPAPMLRRIDTVTRLTMASGKQALDDAGYRITRENMNRTGVIYATGTGPLETIEAINRGIIEKGIHAVDPSAFSNSVLNAAPGNLSIAWQLKGPISALSMGQASGLIGIDYAARVLRHRQADAMIAVCADEGCEPLQMGFDKLGYASVNGQPAAAEGADGLMIAPGSVALLLERRRSAEKRGARIYAAIRGFSMTADNSPIAGFSPDGKALKDAALLALAEAGMTETDLYVSAANGVHAFDRAEGKAMTFITGERTLATAPQALLGTAVGSVGGYGVLSALYSFAEGKAADLPDGEYRVAADLAGKLHKGENRTGVFRTALIAATSFGGTCACMVIEKENGRNG